MERTTLDWTKWRIALIVFATAVGIDTVSDGGEREGPFHPRFLLCALRDAGRGGGSGLAAVMGAHSSDGRLCLACQTRHT